MTDKNEVLKQRLTDLQYHVTQEAGTERAFTGEYWNHFERGDYLCICCGKPLFNSNHKFESGCGWPSFDRSVTASAVVEHFDDSHGMRRTEVVCANCDSHLGHVFSDGPQDSTGLRYCINSAAIDFEASND